MTLMLLSHLLHPHSAVSSKIELSSPLAGVILISPWTKFATDDDSASRNHYSDYVTPAASHRWAGLFLGENTPPPSQNFCADDCKSQAQERSTTIIRQPLQMLNGFKAWMAKSRIF